MRRRILEVCVIAVALMAALVAWPADGVERWFSTGGYPVVQRTLTALTNSVPFAVLDVLLVVATVATLIAVTRAVRRSWRARSFAPAVGTLLSLAAAAAAVFLVFLGLWGLNYRRVPLERRLQLSATTATTDEVLALGARAVRQLNALHAEAHRIGWAAPEWQTPSLIGSAARVHARLTGGTAATPARAKQSILGPYFRWTGVDGMVNPFGLEVIINPDLLPFERPFVVAHEWAHLAGFADESAASFVGFLTTMGASAPARYSGWLYLYWQVAGEVDDSGRTRLWDGLAAGPRDDVQAIVTRLREGQLPRLRVASWLVYDQYLKANRVEAGVRSYGEVVTLLVRSEFQTDWVPVLRSNTAAP